MSGRFKERPNIAIIMTDQQQARACAREGFALDTTPFLDSLAREGVWFDKAYTPSPVCAPARVSMLTGRHPASHGVRSNPGLRRPPRYEKDLFEILTDAGYATALVGKNHSHVSRDRVDHSFPLGHSGGTDTPCRRSESEKEFDEWLSDLRHGVAETPTPFPVECQGPARAVRDAMEWIAQLKREGRPFFIWLSFAEPHNPYQVPDPYFSMFPPDKLPPTRGTRQDAERKGFKWQFVGRLGRRAMEDYDGLLPRMRSNYYGMLRLIDDQVKVLTQALAHQGLRDNTLLLFISDHGDFVGDYGLMRKGPEVPEDLMRIPFLVSGPGVARHRGPHPAHVSLVDIMPTLCEAIGVDPVPGVQGKSLWPLLAGEPYPAEEFASVYAEHGFGGLDYGWEDGPDYEKCSPYEIRFDCLNQYTQCGTRRMLRRGRWKLVFDARGAGQLYDLDADPAELANRFGDPSCAEERRQLVEELLTAVLRAQDPLPLPGEPYQPKMDPRNYWSAQPSVRRDRPQH